MISIARSRTSEESRRIETLRGLACILVVAFHTVGAKSTGGMHVADDSIYRQMCEMLVHLRMPLFTFLSGLVYAYRPVTPETLRAFAQHKLFRLIVPLVIVSTIYYLCSRVLPYEKEAIPLSQMWRIYVFPFNQYWFLQAMVIIFALIAVLDSCRLLRDGRAFLVAFAIASFFSVGVQVEPDVFSLDHALHLLPFFLLGVGVIRFRGWFKSPYAVTAFTAVLLVTLSLHALAVLGVVGQVAERRSLIGLIIGCCGVLTLLRWFPINRALEFLGGYSFTIYLYHAFFTAGSRAVLKMAGMTSDELMFIGGLVLGLGGPIVTEWVLKPIPAARRTLLGQA